MKNIKDLIDEGVKVQKKKLANQRRQITLKKNAQALMLASSLVGHDGTSFHRLALTPEEFQWVVTSVLESRRYAETD